MDRPDIRFGAVTIDCAPHQHKQMVEFYQKLLNLTLEGQEDELGTFPYLYTDHFGITIQAEEGYTPPTWPDMERGQQIHLDLLTKDIPAAVAYALSIGATESKVQYARTWHIMLDPAGHPFCFCQMADE